MATSPDQLDGVLPVDKPAGPTSHDAVAIARRALGTRRVGHTGTLDPFASGLLLLCIGRATRIAQYLTHLPKTYLAVLRLGEETDTLDHTGTVTASSDAWRALGRERVETALRRRVGRQRQTPPAYSAKKVAGERLYQMARRGEAVAPQAVEIDIFNLTLVGWEPPFVSFETTCSSGTYVRAMARDIGLDLDTFAHLVELRRTAIGTHSLAAAVPLQELQQGPYRETLLSPLDALPHLPRVVIDDAAAVAIRFGRAIAVPPDLSTAPAVLVVWQDTLLAIGEVQGGRLHPRQVFDA